MVGCVEIQPSLQGGECVGTSPPIGTVFGSSRGRGGREDSGGVLGTSVVCVSCCRSSIGRGSEIFFLIEIIPRVRLERLCLIIDYYYSLVLVLVLLVVVMAWLGVY